MKNILFVIIYILFNSITYGQSVGYRKESTLCEIIDCTEDNLLNNTTKIDKNRRFCTTVHNDSIPIYADARFYDSIQIVELIWTDSLNLKNKKFPDSYKLFKNVKYVLWIRVFEQLSEYYYGDKRVLPYNWSEVFPNVEALQIHAYPYLEQRYLNEFSKLSSLRYLCLTADYGEEDEALLNFINNHPSLTDLSLGSLGVYDRHLEVFVKNKIKKKDFYFWAQWHDITSLSKQFFYKLKHKEKIKKDDFRYYYDWTARRTKRSILAPFQKIIIDIEVWLYAQKEKRTERKKRKKNTIF